MGKHQIQVCTTQKEIISQTDKYLVILSSNLPVWLIISFSVRILYIHERRVQTSMHGDCNLFYAKA